MIRRTEAIEGNYQPNCVGWWVYRDSKRAYLCYVAHCSENTVEIDWVEEMPQGDWNGEWLGPIL